MTRAVVDALGLQRSTYEGPTGIVGVLHDACQRAGIPSASLWAAVPTYVPGRAVAEGGAGARRADGGRCVGVPVITTDLEIASASYERQISELVACDDDTAAYVARLELEPTARSTDVDDRTSATRRRRLRGRAASSSRSSSGSCANPPRRLDR